MRTIFQFFLVSLASAFVNTAVAQTTPEIRQETIKTTLAPNNTVAHNVQCALGKKVSGGGFQIGNPKRASVIQSKPDETGTAWVVGVMNTSEASGSIEFTVYAICM